MRWVLQRRFALFTLLTMLAAGCDGGEALRESASAIPIQSSTVSYKDSNVVEARSEYRHESLGAIPGSNSNAGAETEVVGTGRFTNDQPPASGEWTDAENGVTLNLVNAPITQAAKTVLGDILKVNYTVSDQVKGNITLQTTRPVSRDGLIDAFEASLKTAGVAVLQSSDIYRIVPAAGVPQFGTPIARNGALSGLGVQSLIIQLNYVSASEMKRLIEPIAHQGSVLRADDRRNLLVVSGTARELEDIQSQIRLFDADWMRGMSVGLYPVRTSDPEVIAKELDVIFGVDGKEAPLRGLLRFIPNRRLGSVLVISTKPVYLDKAKDWIERLDNAAQESEQRLFVYKVQNRSATELASVLQRVLSDGKEQTGIEGSAVAPRFDEVETTAAAPSSAGDSGQSDTVPSLAKPAASTIETATSDIAQGPGPSVQIGMTKIVADQANNALLIQASAKEYDRILRILRTVDMLPTQVMLEAVIAEVSLNDELKFGLKWYFEKKNNSFTLSDAVNGAVASAFPGFSYFFSTSSVQVALDALSTVTRVNVVSAPSVMAMDNRKATLQIGDQVPIITQTAQSVTNPDAPVVNSVTLKDTGVILSVTPRVSDSGRVVLEVEQEVSNVSRTTSSGIDSPTIQQRKVKTTVVIRDGEVLALGGLIQQRDEVGKKQVPILGNIPVVGTMFGQKSDTIDKTELVIFIRPSVVRDVVEARDVTEEFRSRISVGSLRPTKGTGHYERDLDRIAR